MVIYVVLGFFFIWLIFLSWVLFKTRQHYLNLISRTKREKIDEILEELTKNDAKFGTEIDKIKKDLLAVIDHARIPIQKVGLVRFNPFERTGGEQSFVLSLLNRNNNGLLINFIYTREGLRVYIKKVKDSKGEKYELSEEEKEAIKQSS